MIIEFYVFLVIFSDRKAEAEQTTQTHVKEEKEIETQTSVAEKENETQTSVHEKETETQTSAPEMEQSGHGKLPYCGKGGLANLMKFFFSQ